MSAPTSRRANKTSSNKKHNHSQPSITSLLNVPFEGEETGGYAKRFLLACSSSTAATVPKSKKRKIAVPNGVRLKRSKTFHHSWIDDTGTNQPTPVKTSAPAELDKLWPMIFGEELLQFTKTFE